MNLVLDIGNSSIKAGLFNESVLIETRRLHDLKELPALFDMKQVEFIAICSVGIQQKDIDIENIFMFVDASTPMPFSINYNTPLTLGSDRLAAVAGANALFPDRHCLVIDSGTCLTFEVITNNNEYQGGAISPGIDMRFKAMHNYTASLPLVEADTSFDLIGKSTIDCMKSGVLNGFVNEINGVIEQYQARFENLQIILCGGNLHLFESKVKASIFVQPDLVLLGLNTILEYNVG